VFKKKKEIKINDGLVICVGCSSTFPPSYPEHRFCNMLCAAEYRQGKV